jgi:hypothetical protein
MIRAALMVLIASCAKPAVPPTHPDPPNDPTERPTRPDRPGASIGSASMLPDGTIQLMLRAEGNGAIGDALLIYEPSHPQYQSIRDHLGGLQPGESKPVPPFPSH